VKLSDITAGTIEDFKEKRLSAGVRTATINRDLAVLHRMMQLAERKLQRPVFQVLLGDLRRGLLLMMSRNSRVTFS